MIRRFPVPAGSTKYTPAEVVQFFGRLCDDNEDKQFIKQAREYVLDVRQLVPFACDRTFRRFLATHVFAASPQPAPSRWMTKGRPRLVSIEGCKVFAETRSKNTSAPLNTAVASAFIQEEMQKAQEATKGHFRRCVRVLLPPSNFQPLPMPAHHNPRTTRALTRHPCLH